MDLKILKEKFEKKSCAGVEDVQIALEATPFLVREVVKLKSKLEASNKRIANLQQALKEKYPLSIKGSKDGALWEIAADLKRNRLRITLRGRFTYYAAKKTSNAALSVASSLTDGFDVVNDISAVTGIEGPKVLFQMKKSLFNLDVAGVGRVVRVVNPDDKLQKAVTNKTLIEGLDVITAKSAEEADHILDTGMGHLAP